MNDINLTEKNGQILVSSRDVAENFDKRHTHVLDTIKGFQNDLSTAEFSALFIPSTYIASNGKENRAYFMNRDGFSLICMGFTGKKALTWKLKYIEAFNSMEEKLKTGTVLSEEEKYKLQLFSKDPNEVAMAHKKLVELATTPLIEQIEEQRPKVEYHDDVLNKDGLITTTVIAKDLGLRSAAKLNNIMHLAGIIFKNKSGTWCPYADYEWLIKENYADYQSYRDENSKPCLKWTEKGRKWIIGHYDDWVRELTE